MNRGGRPTHNVYKQLGFVQMRIGGKHCAKCYFCGIVVKNTARERLKAHRRACGRRNLQEPALLEFTQPSTGMSLEEIVDNSSAMENLRSSNSAVGAHWEPEATTSLLGVKRSCSSESTMPYIAKMNTGEKNEIDLSLAKFLFGCNIPFSVMDSKYFKDLLQRLSPCYQLPGKEAISNKLLDEVFEDVSKQSNVDPYSVLLFDIWKNEFNNTKKVVTVLHNCCATSGKPESVFLEVFDLSDETKVEDKLCEIVKEAVEIAETQYNTTVYCTVSANARNMEKLHKSYDMWDSVCNSHIADLLTKDLLPLGISSQVNEVLKAFINTEQQDLLLANGGSRVCLTVNTPWYSQRDACVSLKTNIIAMCKVAAIDECDKIPKMVKYLLYDDDFLTQVDVTIMLLNPVSRLIKACQKPESSVADAAELWLTLKLPDNHNDKLHLVEKRQKQSLNIYSLAANVLHPQYQGQNMNEQQHDQVEEFIMKTLDAEGLTSFQQYREKVGKFGELIEKGVKSPKTFWFFAKRHHRKLGDLADKLLKIPASTAQLERVFSNWSSVHSTNKNNLSFERSQKLEHVYYKLKMKDQTCDYY